MYLQSGVVFRRFFFGCSPPKKSWEIHQKRLARVGYTKNDSTVSTSKVSFFKKRISLHLNCRKKPSSHNHGSSLKNVCISNRIVTFQIVRHFHWTHGFMGERVWADQVSRADWFTPGHGGPSLEVLQGEVKEPLECVDLSMERDQKSRTEMRLGCFFLFRESIYCDQYIYIYSHMFLPWEGSHWVARVPLSCQGPTELPGLNSMIIGLDHGLETAPNKFSDHKWPHLGWKQI